MSSRPLSLFAIAILHWMLLLTLFFISCMAIGGWEMAVLCIIIAGIASAPFYLLYPLFLRIAALLQPPWIGLVVTLIALLAVNDWLFHEIGYESTTPPSNGYYMSDTPPLLSFSFGFSESIALPLRRCVGGATVLSTAALSLLITGAFRRLGPQPPRPLN